jgi:GNAT superfamily N-acetyltransferase
VADTNSKPIGGEIRIVDYAEKFRATFKALNEAWITRYFRIEEADRRALEQADAYILGKGGHILVALDRDEPVGVCALIKLDDRPAYELAKMAVASHLQGRGIGHQLALAAIAWARVRGARRLFLESNTILEPAIRLYRKLGFVEIKGPPSAYARSNIQMELLLG